MVNAIQNNDKIGSGSALLRSKRLVLSVLALAALNASSVASATEDRFEFWLNPSMRYWMDEKTSFRIETAQRFRSEDDGRPDTYFGRFWAGRRFNDNLSVEIGVEKRINDGDADETRLLQQLLTRHGIFRNRIRLEQRFVESAPQMGLRLRTEHGVFVPLDKEQKWNIRAEAELFWTLIPTKPGTITGFSELRTELGFVHQLNERMTLGLLYMRQQRVRINRADTVGHAPLIRFEYAFGKIVEP